jgi:hypothetical protein
MDISAKPATQPRQAQASTDLVATMRQRAVERALADPQLPLWPELTRGIPNGVLRSALFGAIKRGKRRFMEREPIPSVNGISIVYSGPRLDQSDLDVWGGVLHLSRAVMLGDIVEFSERAFLRLIGRGGANGKSIGKSDREWLRKVLARLKATSVEITHGPYTYGGSLIDEYFRDNVRGRNVVILNAKIKALFGRDSYTRVDWGIRCALIGHPLAQWLHGFYATHAKPLPYKVETLHRLCGSDSGGRAKTDAERRKAILGWCDDSLVPALRVVERACCDAGQHFAWVILGDGLVYVSRAPDRAGQWAGRERTSGHLLGG